MRTRKIAFFVIAVLLLGLFIFSSNTWIGRGMQTAAFWMVRPLVNAADRVRAVFRGGALTYAEGAEIIRESQRLKAENAELEKLRAENEIFKKALSFKQEAAPALKAAKVLTFSRESGRDFLLLSSGSKDGIKEGDLVVDENRVFVGIVREAGEEHAKVTIASSLGENAEVKILPSGSRALARGIGSGTFLLELIPMEATIRRGDFMFLYPSGGRPVLVLGEIVDEKQQSNVAFRKAHALHLIRPELLEEVFVFGPTP